MSEDERLRAEIADLDRKLRWLHAKLFVYSVLLAVILVSIGYGVGYWRGSSDKSHECAAFQRAFDGVGDAGVK